MPTFVTTGSSRGAKASIGYQHHLGPCSRKSKFSESQIAAIWKQADRVAVADVARKHGVRQQNLRSGKFSANYFHQFPEAIDHVVLDVLWGEAAVHFFEELARAFDFGLLNFAQIHR